MQHLGTVGCLGEEEGGGTAVLLLREGRGGRVSTAGPWEPISPAPPPVPSPVHLDVLHHEGSGRGLQQGHRAATKATTCHAAAINPGRREGGLHQLIQLRTAHLVVVPAKRSGGGGGGGLNRPHPALGGACAREGLDTQGVSPERVVTLHHEAAKGSVVATAQGGRRLGCALDLTHDVSRPPEGLPTHQLPASWGGKGVRRPATHGLWAPVDIGEAYDGSRALGLGRCWGGWGKT